MSVMQQRKSNRIDHGGIPLRSSLKAGSHNKHNECMSGCLMDRDARNVKCFLGLAGDVDYCDGNVNERMLRECEAGCYIQG
jgi:hypothetical protein